MLTHCTLAHRTLGPLKNYVKACSVCRWRGVATGVAFGFPSLVSVVCYRLQYMLRCTLRATLVTRGRVAFYMGPPVVPPYATFYISFYCRSIDP